MWWLFEKVSETSEEIIYRYSNSSEDLDGIITYNKKAWRASVTTPCNKDKRDQFSQFMMDMAIATFNRCFKFKNYFPEGRICITG